jgi:hypothetical protein
MTILCDIANFKARRKADIDGGYLAVVIELLKAEVIHRFGPGKSTDTIEWEALKWVD